MSAEQTQKSKKAIEKALVIMLMSMVSCWLCLTVKALCLSKILLKILKKELSKTGSPYSYIIKHCYT